MFSDVREFRRDPLGFLLERGNTATGQLERLHLGPNPCYLLVDPELIKPLLKMPETEVGKGRLIQKLKPVFGRSSLMLHGDEHKRRRAVLHQYLARGAVERYIPHMCGEIRAVSARLAKLGKFNPHESTATLALRVMCIAVFGKQVVSAGDEQALVAAVNAIEDDIADEMFRVWPIDPISWLARRRRRKFASAAMSLVVSRLRAGASATSALKGLEDLGLSDQDLRDEILTLLLAGHHTTGTTAAWILYHMAAEPGLADELASEATTASNKNGELSADGLKKAPLSQMLVREVLRLYPGAWWFSRETNRDVEFAGYKLKRGTSVIISPWQLQRDPRFWEDADCFRLDRTYTHSSYIPFGAGPRTCAGSGVAMLELQLLALELAAAYRFGEVRPFPAPWPKASVTLIPPPMTIEVELRDQAATKRSAA
jgi:cytochrome P450